MQMKTTAYSVLACSVLCVAYKPCKRTRLCCWNCKTKGSAGNQASGDNSDFSWLCHSSSSAKICSCLKGFCEVESVLLKDRELEVSWRGGCRSSLTLQHGQPGVKLEDSRWIENSTVLREGDFVPSESCIGVLGQKRKHVHTFRWWLLGSLVLDPLWRGLRPGFIPLRPHTLKAVGADPQPPRSRSSHTVAVLLPQELFGA